MAGKAKPLLSLLDLGRWSKRVTVRAGNQEQTIYLRVIGSVSEPQRAGQQAANERLVEYAEGTLARQALETALGMADSEVLAADVLFSEGPKLQEKAARKFPYPPFVRDSKESDEAFAVRQEKHERNCAKLDEQREKWISEQEEARQRELLDLPKQELISSALPIRIQADALLAYVEAYDNQILLRSCYQDPEFRQPCFTGPEEVEQLHPGVRRQLVEGYRALELGEQEIPKVQNGDSAMTTTS